MKNIGIYIKFDINTSSYLDMVSKIKNAGFDSVMLFEDDALELQVKLCNDFNLKIENVHMHYRTINKLWKDDIEGENYFADLLARVDRIAKLNIKTVVVHTVSGPPIFPCPDINEIGLKRMQALAEHCKTKDIKIAIENTDNTSIRHLRYLLDNLNYDNVGFCFDSGHNNLFTKHDNLLNRYSDRLFAIHLHDNFGVWDNALGWKKCDKHLIPFDGKIDWQQLMHELSLTSYTGPLTLELHKDFSGQYDNITSDEFLSKAKLIATKLIKLKN